MSSYEDVRIPAAICGRHGKCRQKWRRIVRRAVKVGSWDQVRETTSWVDPSDAPGLLVLAGYNPLVEGDNTLVYLIHDELANACYDNKSGCQERGYPMHKAMVLAGLPSFWFCLGMLADVGNVFLECESFRREKKLMAGRILSAMLRWWPEFCRLNDRLHWGPPEYTGWSQWSLQPQKFCARLGVPDKKIDELSMLDPSEAGAALGDLLEKYG